MLKDTEELWLIFTASLSSNIYENQFIYTLEQDRYYVNSIMKSSNGSQVTIYNHYLDVQ